MYADRKIILAVNMDIQREANGLRTTVRAVDVEGNVFRPIRVRAIKAAEWMLQGKRITDGAWICISAWHNY